MRRRTSRESALKVLYAWEFTGADPNDLVYYFTDEEEFCVSKPDEFFYQIIQGVLEFQSELDAAIGDHAMEWQFQRISAVDRNILRIAAYELMFLQDTPVAVIINEAIEITKIYGSEESFRFVNGVLDKIKPKEILDV